jgi:hypothetical protein
LHYRISQNLHLVGNKFLLVMSLLKPLLAGIDFCPQASDFPIIDNALGLRIPNKEG